MAVTDLKCRPQRVEEDPLPMRLEQASDLFDISGKARRFNGLELLAGQATPLFLALATTAAAGPVGRFTSTGEAGIRVDPSGPVICAGAVVCTVSRAPADPVADAADAVLIFR